MMHVATVHWRSDRWIDLQLRSLARHLVPPYRVYAFLNDVPGDQAGKYFYSRTDPIEDHATKLNLLADVIRSNAARPDDPIMFIDGDALLVAPTAPLLDEHLDRHRLIAVRRYENNGDVQPHPSFCVSTVGFWSEIEGDWRRGHLWPDLQGHPVTDVGGNLLRSLERAGVDWYPLRRLNRVNPHPLFFGVYGEDVHGAVVYHHGAGFREGLSRVDRVRAGGRDRESQVTARILDRLPRQGMLGAVRDRYHPVRRLERRLTEQAGVESQRVMSRIEHDDEFWREFL
jgi:hypothetical protein